MAIHAPTLDLQLEIPVKIRLLFFILLNPPIYVTHKMCNHDEHGKLLKSVHEISNAFNNFATAL